MTRKYYLLDLKNPEYRSGMNFTVRLGTKWKDRLEPDDIVHIPKGMAVIRKVICCKMADIPDFVLAQEHDSKCRTLEGLMQALKDVYPELADLSYTDPEKLEETTVTCVGFWAYIRA